MSPASTSTLTQWINTCFSELQINPDLLLAYQQFMMREIEQYPESEGFDFYENRDALTEPDEEDSWTHGKVLESRGKEFIDHYAACRAEGHVPKYAEAYATERLSDGYELRVSSSAYEAIGALDQPWSTDNPAYQDVLHACQFKGKDENFAHRCAKSLPDHEFFFKSAFEATVKHEKRITKALSKGRSVTFAVAYAEAWNIFAEVEEVALNYAECFEKLLGAGRSSDEADSIAYTYASKHLEGHVDDEEDLGFELDKDEALAKAESGFRFRELPAEDKKLPELFLRICQRQYPTNHSKQWFDEIETLARSVLSGNVKLEDIQRSSYMECLEEESLREESEKPSRFDLMSEEEFKTFRPKSEDEQELWESEAQFREDCREMELDPTDPDERERYEEILDETRNDN